MSEISSSCEQTVVVIRLQSGLNHKEHNITFSLWTHWKAGQISDDQLLTPHLLSSLIFPHCLLYFIFCFFSPSPCNFFVQRIKFHLRGLWERRPSDWPLPVQMLWIYGAFLPSRRSGAGWRDGWWGGGIEMGGVEGGVKPACISWGLGVRWAPSEEVSGPGLPGWLGNWPPSDSSVLFVPCQHVAPGRDRDLGSVPQRGGSPPPACRTQPATCITYTFIHISNPPSNLWRTASFCCHFYWQ